MLLGSKWLSDKKEKADTYCKKMKPEKFGKWYQRRKENQQSIWRGSRKNTLLAKLEVLTLYSHWAGIAASLSTVRILPINWAIKVLKWRINNEFNISFLLPVFNEADKCCSEQHWFCKRLSSFSQGSVEAHKAALITTAPAPGKEHGSGGSASNAPGKEHYDVGSASYCKAALKRTQRQSHRQR